MPKSTKSVKYKDYDGVREIKLDPSQWETTSEDPSDPHLAVLE